MGGSTNQSASKAAESQESGVKDKFKSPEHQTSEEKLRNADLAFLGDIQLFCLNSAKTAKLQDNQLACQENIQKLVQEASKLQQYNEKADKMMKAFDEQIQR